MEIKARIVTKRLKNLEMSERSQVAKPEQFSPLPKISSRRIIKMKKAKKNLNTSRVSILSVSKFDDNQVAEISVFDIENSVETRLPLFYGNDIKEAKNFMQSNMDCLSVGKKQNVRGNSSTPVPKPRHIVKQINNRKMINDGSENFMKKSPIPINLKLAQISKNQEKELLERKQEEINTKIHKIDRSRNCQTPNAFRRCELIKPNLEFRSELEKLIKHFKIKIMLKAYLCIKRKFNITTRLSIVAKNLTNSTFCSLESKVRRIIQEMLINKNKFQNKINNEFFNSQVHPLKRSNNVVDIHDKIKNRRKRVQKILMHKRQKNQKEKEIIKEDNLR